MRKNGRAVDPIKQLRRLERRHARLSEQVAELEERVYLTPEEQMRVQRLKKEKLAAKDELTHLRRRLGLGAG